MEKKKNVRRSFKQLKHSPTRFGEGGGGARTSTSSGHDFWREHAAPSLEGGLTVAAVGAFLVISPSNWLTVTHGRAEVRGFCFCLGPVSRRPCLASLSHLSFYLVH